jgi:phage tail tape-measure protein
MEKRTFKLCFSTLFIVMVLSAGCATTGKSVGTGAVIGGVAGATAGALADPGDGGQNRLRNVVIGSAIGGALGAGAGWMLHQEGKDGRQESYEKGKSDAKLELSNSYDASSGGQPKLVQPKTEAHWVPDQIRGNTFVPAHFEYVIIQSAHWETGR